METGGWLVAANLNVAPGFFRSYFVRTVFSHCSVDGAWAGAATHGWLFLKKDSRKKLFGNSLPLSAYRVREGLDCFT